MWEDEILERFLARYLGLKERGWWAQSRGLAGDNKTVAEPGAQPGEGLARRGDIVWNCRTCRSCDACYHESDRESDCKSDRDSDQEGHDVFFHRTA